MLWEHFSLPEMMKKPAVVRKVRFLASQLSSKSIVFCKRSTVSIYKENFRNGI